jgi:serine protease Do
MNRVLSTAVLLLPLLGCASSAISAEDPLNALQKRVISVSNEVTPSVVNIEAALRQNTRRQIVTGSGFIMNADGIVLTNEHVVERAEKVTVIVPGRPGNYPAEVVGTDKQTDLAVLRIIKPAGEKPFSVAKMGDSEVISVGQWVIAIGNPYGLDGTVSLGIVSAKGRDLPGDELLNDFIQTDAMIDRGSSGGPLVNLKAEVVGINSRGQGRGIGFTIPINTAKRVAQDLLGQGKIARGYLGVSLQPLNRDLARYWKLETVNGVVINGITKDSPAQKAGLKVGDILATFDGVPVSAEKDEDIGQLQRLVASHEVGKQVPVQVYRAGKAETFKLTIGSQPKVVPDEEETDHGFIVQEITESLTREFRLNEGKGVMVSFVEPGSEAAEAGMTPGDLIQEVEGSSIDDIDGFRSTMGKLKSTAPFLVRARRGDDFRFMLIDPRGRSDKQARRPGGAPEDTPVDAPAPGHGEGGAEG